MCHPSLTPNASGQKCVHKLVHSPSRENHRPRHLIVTATNPSHLSSSQLSSHHPNSLAPKKSTFLRPPYLLALHFIPLPLSLPPPPPNLDPKHGLDGRKHAEHHNDHDLDAAAYPQRRKVENRRLEPGGGLLGRSRLGPVVAAVIRWKRGGIRVLGRRARACVGAL